MKSRPALVYIIDQVGRSTVRNECDVGVRRALRSRICVRSDPLAGASGASFLAHSAEHFRWRCKDTFDLPSFAFAATVRSLPQLLLLRRGVELHEVLPLATIKL